MAHPTALLSLHLNTILDSLKLSRLLTAAIQKVQTTLYVKVQLTKPCKDIVCLNNTVDQIYYLTSKKAPLLDARVILRDYRDSVFDIKENDVPLRTAKKVSVVLAEELSQSSVLDLFPNHNGNVQFEKLQTCCNTDGQIDIVKRSNFANIDNLADPKKTYDEVVLGGTFDRLHAGHKILLSAAILRCKRRLTIGVTDGPMVHSKKLWELIEPCHLRVEKLKDFLVDVEPRLEYNIVPIQDPYGPTAYDPTLQMLVVSEETLVGGYKVNQVRKEKGLSILDIHPISLLQDDLSAENEEEKISSSSLRKRLLGTHLQPPKSKTKPFIIGLTGGIASGKTSICNRLKQLGAEVISCDHLGHKAYLKGTECYLKIVEHFGTDILDSNEEIDRKKLGPIVFADKDQLQKLNSIVWPEIRRLYLEEIHTLKNQENIGIIVLDAAILLEAGWDQDCSEVWVSFVPENEAVKRIMERDKLPNEQATKRIKSQLSNSERIAKANVVFCSLWEPEETANQVKTAWNQVQSYFSTNEIY